MQLINKQIGTVITRNSWDFELLICMHESMSPWFTHMKPLVAEQNSR